MATKQPVRFSDDEIKAIQQAAKAAFDYVAGDLFVTIAEDGEISETGVSISRAEAIELALDADRAADQLRVIRRRDRIANRESVVTDDFLARFEQAGYEQLKRIVRPAFPHSRYGM
jgi:hypothetical protein